MERKDKEKAEKAERERAEKERKEQEKKKKKKKKDSMPGDSSTLPDGFRVSGLAGEGATEGKLFCVAFCWLVFHVS